VLHTPCSAAWLLRACRVCHPCPLACARRDHASPAPPPLETSAAGHRSERAPQRQLRQWQHPVAAMRQVAANSKIFEIQIMLRDAGPPINRRVRVLDEPSFAELHDVVQAAMDWTNSHLHEFRFQGAGYGLPDPTRSPTFRRSAGAWSAVVDACTATNRGSRHSSCRAHCVRTQSSERPRSEHQARTMVGSFASGISRSFCRVFDQVRHVTPCYPTQQSRRLLGGDDRMQPAIATFRGGVRRDRRPPASRPPRAGTPVARRTHD
jgi:Plasmid pRiA4b ORF-3-like protein